MNCTRLCLCFDTPQQLKLVLLLQGRILVLETKIQQQKLHIVCEKETRGAVYTISGFQVLLCFFCCSLVTVLCVSVSGDFPATDFTSKYRLHKHVEHKLAWQDRFWAIHT